MKPVSLIALSFSFSAFGDRLWTFAVGLYLVKLTPGSLQLAAIYGLVLTATAILFSPLIGQYVDNNNRLRVIRTLLVLQNFFVMLSATCVLLYLQRITTNIHILQFLKCMIILLGSIANIAGVGEKIAVSKDWLVVICKGNCDVLAHANGLLRRIDLTVAVLAPIGVGFLMTIISDLAGIVFILVWNVIAMLAEYLLLYVVYQNDHDLANKKTSSDNSINKDEPNEVDCGTDKSQQDDSINSPTDKKCKSDKLLATSKKPSKFNFNPVLRFQLVVSGWKIYRKQTVFLAGSALAWLYLTVLGFNEITTSFAYSQGLQEVYVSVCFGLGSVLGIFGTFLFPLMRKRFGLSKTGILGNLFQLSMLSLCIVSIWLPGSPTSFLSNQDVNLVQPSINCSHNATTKTMKATNMCINPFSVKKNISIIVFMMGIILSRAGLWISDLTITQLQQENVVEAERGTVGGVQFSFNSIFNLLQYVVTILLPYPDQFWILILMSVFAVVVSFFVYISFHVNYKRQLVPPCELHVVA